MENRQDPATQPHDQIPQADHDGERIQNAPQAIHGSEGESECEICGGTGEEIFDEYDPDSHQYQRGTGVRKCLCQIEEPEPEQ